MKFLAKKTVLVSMISLSMVTVSFAAISSQQKGFIFIGNATQECVKHNGFHYEHNDPTCTESGNKEYWVCCTCHSVFLDGTSAPVTNGIWSTHSISEGVGGIPEEAYIASTGHTYGSYDMYDSTNHYFTCLNCDYVLEESHHMHDVPALEPTCVTPGHTAYQECTICDYHTSYDIIPASSENHNYESSVTAPSAPRRGYTTHTCSYCDDSYIDSFDFSEYEGVTFAANHNKHLIPYSFGHDTYTIEASLNLPTSFTSRGGVVLGSYGLDASFNLEINANGQVRLYFVDEEGTASDYHFNEDIRSSGVKNIAVTIVSNSNARLYVDGVFKQQITLNNAIPVIGQRLNVGGDNRTNNTQYFKGTLYAVSIYRDVRTDEEIIQDIILSDQSDPNHCVTYNLIDESYLTDSEEPGQDPYLFAAVNTVDKLAYHCSIGTESIKVTADLVLDRTIYAIGNVTIYCDEDHSITRDPDFEGDMFVFGENAAGRNLILDDITCNIAFGKSSALGTLTIDGNKDNMNEGVLVNGSLVYVSYSATFTLNDNAALVNAKKVSNHRSYENDQDHINRYMGGAAVAIYSGVFNMTGGEITDCEVNDYDLADGDSTDTVNYRLSSYGGAIFNYGNLYMTGGTISGGRAFYGGGIFNMMIATVTAGTISDNFSTYAGGGIFCYNNTRTQLYVGSDDQENGTYNVVFENNSTTSMGGAIYGGVYPNVLIYGSAKFVNNSASNRGGAIGSKGYLGIKSNTLFRGNTSTSQNGGAVSIYYDAIEPLLRRECEITGAIFDQNEGKAGGALDTAGGYIELTNCTFTSNNAAKSAGGAVYINSSEEGTIGANLTFANCTFTTNTANYVSPSDAKYEAGAIFADKMTSLTVDNCTFTSNSCSSSGGAICTHGATLVDIDDSSFVNNTAGTSGGALYLSVRNFTLDEVTTTYETTSTIENCYFNGNSSTVSGGAVYTYRSSEEGKGVIFTECIFEANRAYLETEVDSIVTKSGNGGAIYSSNSNFDAIGCEFTDNVAGGNGGAIFVYGSVGLVSGANASGNTSYGNGGFAYLSSTNGSALTVNGNSVISSSNGKSGAAFYAAASSILNIASSTVSESTSSDHGGAIYITNATLNVDNVTFDQNVANSTTYGGGVIYSAARAIVTIEHSTFTDNQAKYGGAIYANTGSQITLVNITATGNVATSNGGFAYINKTSGEAIARITIEADELLTNTISNNTAAGGAGFYINNGKLIMSDTVLSGNISTASGGALYVKENGSATLTSCTVSDNHATNGLGAIVYGGTLIVSNSSFEDNVISGGSGEGGALYVRGGDNDEVATVTISNTVFSGNVSVSRGGAISIKVNTLVAITDCTFTSNSSAEGGAISSYTSFEVTGTDFNTNSASTTGGAIHLYTNGQATVEDCNFSGNTSTTTGGAINFTNNSVGVLTDCTFIGNEATTNGGALYFGSTSSATLDGCTFTENNAASNGGAMYFGTSSHIEATNCDYTLNTSPNGGAVMFNSTSYGTFVGCTFSQNSASNSAGAVRLTSSAHASFTNCSFTENTATSGNGGAMYLDASTYSTLSGCTFTSNSAASGGAMRVGSSASTASYVTVTNCTFTSNTATGNGGALYLYAANSVTSTFTGCSFISNSTASSKSGGAAYISGATVAVFENTIARNNSATTGSAFAITNATGNTTNVTFSGTYTSLNNTISIGNATTNVVTIHQSGLISEDDPAKTWSDILTGKTSNVIFN